MSNKKHKINIKHPERALLTDTTPYELPIFFTNANLAILAFTQRRNLFEHPFYSSLLLCPSLDSIKTATKPYPFEIRKGPGSTRRLDLAHPRSQHLMSLFYAEYDHFISNACSRSDYSLRYPSRIATHYVDPKYSSTERKDHAADEDPIGFRNQSLWASTYFSYRDYNLSHKFFESDDFLSLEKKFSFLLKIDVSRCFDSIYTHAIEWSMRGKDFSKKHLPTQHKQTFESKFDAVIRHANWNETHGIIIGPEASRIFAEIILQSVDRTIKENIPHPLGEKVIIKRYVDDYYLFSETKQQLEDAKNIIKRALGILNLHLNEDKTELTNRPFISKITAARSRVSSAIDSFASIMRPLTGFPGDAPSARHVEWARTALIGSFRKIAIELDVPYEHVSSFALSVLNRQISSAVESCDKHKPDLDRDHLSRLSWLIAVIRIGQFLFAIDQRVTTSVKLARLYSSTITLTKKLKCARGAVEGQIIDGLRNTDTQEAHGASDEIARINHICAVDMLMTEDRRVDVNDLKQHLDYNDAVGALENVSLFQLLAITFISRKRQRFKKALESAKIEIERRITLKHVKFQQDTEAAILLADYLSCPYFDKKSKQSLIKTVHKKIVGKDCTKSELEKILAASTWMSFTDWLGHSNIQAMLARKELTPAYE